MGTKASFALAQLTDLLWIEHQYQVLYDKTIDEVFYKKVGDDNVLWDPKDLFASVYETIGVPINIAKSKFKTQFGTFIEFVSRNSWNNQDYSQISPGLTSKYLRNSFYLPVLYDHIAQRDTNPPTVTELIRYKKEVFEQSKENFSLDKFEAFQATVLKIMTVMQVATSKSLLDPDEMVPISNQELILLVRNLVLAVLAEFVRLAEFQLKDKKGALAEESANLLSREFKLIRQKDSYFKGNKDFFSKVVSENYTFKEVILLWQALPATTSIAHKFSSGIGKLTEFPVYDPFVRTETGILVLNPDYISFLMDLEWKIRNQLQVHRTLQKGPNFCRARPTSVVESYKFLNKVIRSNVDILDIETGSYRDLKDRDKKLCPKLIKGYSFLLKTTEYLENINTYADQEVRLFEEPHISDSK
jgi:hypothetical protein